MSEDEAEEKGYFLVPATHSETFSYFLELQALESSAAVDTDVQKQLDAELARDFGKVDGSADLSTLTSAEPSEDSKAWTRKRRRKRDSKEQLRQRLLIDGFLLDACFEGVDATAHGSHSMARDSYSPMADIVFVANNRLFPSALTDIVADYYTSTVFWLSELSDTFIASKMRRFESGLQVSGGGTVRMRDAVQSGELAVFDVMYVNGRANNPLGGCYFTGVISQATAHSLTAGHFEMCPYSKYSVFKPYGVDDANDCYYTGGKERNGGIGKQRYFSRTVFRFAVDLRNWRKPQLAFAIPKENLEKLFVIPLPKAVSEEATSWYPLFCPYNNEAYARVQFK